MDLEEIKKNKFWAGVILYNLNTREVLLQKRDEKVLVNPKKWGFFGGVGEKEEDPKDCVWRELKEELGIEIAREKLLPFRSYLSQKHQTWRYVYSLPFSVPKNKMTLSEGEDFDWVFYDQSLKLDLTDNTRLDLELFLQPGRH